MSRYIRCVSSTSLITLVFSGVVPSAILLQIRSPVFPWVLTEWNKIDFKIQNSSYSVFINYLLKEIRPKPSPLYYTYNPSGIKLLTRLRLGLSHLNERKINNSFYECVNPFCTCSSEPESTSHFFLHCCHYNTIISILFKDLKTVDKNLFKLSENELNLILLYGSTQYSLTNNCILLNSSIKYTENSKRFSGPLFWFSGIFPLNVINSFNVT